MTLDELFLKFGSDKSSAGHGYSKVYQEKFSRDAKKIFELGVYKGSSMMAWRNYFNHGAVLHCLDWFGDPDGVNERWCKIKGFVTYKGDTRKPETFDQIKENDFDIIIEDCGHTHSAQIQAFKHLFPKVKSGGIMAIEDCHTCTEEFYRDGLCKSFYDTILGTVLKSTETKNGKPVWRNPYFNKEESKLMESMIDHVEIHCDEKLILFYKK